MPCMKTRSSVRPRLCVGPETCYTRLNDIAMFKGSMASESDGLLVYES